MCCISPDFFFSSSSSFFFPPLVKEKITLLNSAVLFKNLKPTPPFKPSPARPALPGRALGSAAAGDAEDAPRGIKSRRGPGALAGRGAPCEVLAIVPRPEGSFSIEPASPLISARSAQRRLEGWGHAAWKRAGGRGKGAGEGLRGVRKETSSSPAFSFHGQTCLGVEVAQRPRVSAFLPNEEHSDS